MPILRSFAVITAATIAVTTVLALASCRAPAPYEPGIERQSESGAAASGSTTAQPAAREFRLGGASSTLVAQAHSSLAAGDYAAATATLERALRIEPANPLLWIELGRVHETSGNYRLADSMARKAAMLAAGDPAAESAAWSLLAEALHAQGRPQEADAAARRATQPTRP
jgi:Tfp pilus assembly protein PilF